MPATRIRVIPIAIVVVIVGIAVSVVVTVVVVVRIIVIVIIGLLPATVAVKAIVIIPTKTESRIIDIASVNSWRVTQIDGLVPHFWQLFGLGLCSALFRLLFRLRKRCLLRRLIDWSLLSLVDRCLLC